MSLATKRSKRNANYNCVAMKNFILVCAGGAIGSGARYLLVLGMSGRGAGGFPIATLLVNLSGSFLIGLVASAFDSEAISNSSRLLLGTGLLGGFTTYSAFNLETVKLFENGSSGLAIANLFVTVVACLAAGVGGLLLGRLLFPANL